MRATCIIEFLQDLNLGFTILTIGCKSTEKKWSFRWNEFIEKSSLVWFDLLITYPLQIYLSFLKKGFSKFVSHFGGSKNTIIVAL